MWITKRVKQRFHKLNPSYRVQKNVYSGDSDSFTGLHTRERKRPAQNGVAHLGHNGVRSQKRIERTVHSSDIVLVYIYNKK